MVEKVAAKSVSGWKTPGAQKVTSENTLRWKVPFGGKYLAVENVWPSKKLQPLSESEEKHQLLPFISCSKRLK